LAVTWNVLPEQVIRLHCCLNEFGPSSYDLEVGKRPLFYSSLPLLVVLNACHELHCLLILLTLRNVLVEVDLPVKELD